MHVQIVPATLTSNFLVFFSPMIIMSRDSRVIALQSLKVLIQKGRDYTSRVNINLAMDSVGTFVHDALASSHCLIFASVRAPGAFSSASSTHSIARAKAIVSGVSGALNQIRPFVPIATSKGKRAPRQGRSGWFCVSSLCRFRWSIAKDEVTENRELTPSRVRVSIWP